MKYFLIFLLLGSLCSCLKENKIVLKNDLEKPVIDWGYTSIQKGNAHSGHYYTYTDSLHPFSAAFSKRLNEISSHKIIRIDIVTWIKKSDFEGTASFVLSLDKGGDPVYWKSMSTREAAPEINEWTRMYASYDLPDSLGSSENLKVYVWNISQYPIDADDFEIRLYY